MTTAKTPVTPNYTGDLTAYNGALDQGIAANSIIANQFQPHEAGTPNMTVVLERGGLAWDGGPVFGLLTSAAMVAPVTPGDSKYYRIGVYSFYLNGFPQLRLIEGVEGASPAKPDYGMYDIPVCSVLIPYSKTAIVNDDIDDERNIDPFNHRTLKSDLKNDTYRITNASIITMTFSGTSLVNLPVINNLLVDDVILLYMDVRGARTVVGRTDYKVRKFSGTGNFTAGVWTNDAWKNWYCPNTGVLDNSHMFRLRVTTNGSLTLNLTGYSYSSDTSIAINELSLEATVLRNR